MKHSILLSFFLILCVQASAQWTFGLSHTSTYTTVNRSNARRVDEVYSGLWNGGFSVQAEYGLPGTAFLETGLVFTPRSYRTDRTNQTLEFVYTVRKNSYVLLPVMCGVSTKFGRMQLRTMAGGFCGYWLKAEKEGCLPREALDGYEPYLFNAKVDFTSENRRINAGLVGGAGLAIPIAGKIGLSADALYYYDLVSHNKGYKNLPDNRYFNSLTVNTGLYYTF